MFHHGAGETDQIFHYWNAEASCGNDWGLTAPGVGLFRGLKDTVKKPLVYSKTNPGTQISDQFVEWANFAVIPTYFEYSDLHNEVIFNHQIPIIFHLSADKASANQEVMKGASVAFEGKMFFANSMAVDQHLNDILEMGANQDLPALLIVQPKEEGHLKKFIYKGDVKALTQA